MRIDPRFDFSHLTAAERVQLAQDLWASLGPDEIAAECPLSEEQQAELDRRLADLERSPDCGLPWEEVRERLAARLGRVGRDQRTPQAE